MTERDPRLLAAWSAWLARHERTQQARPLAHEALDGLLGRLEAGQDDDTAIRSLVAILGQLDRAKRRDVLGRIEALLADRPERLVAVGQRLIAQSWAGCEVAGARMCVAALRAEADAPGAVDGIAAALDHVEEFADVEPVVVEALGLTERDPRLLAAWSAWLTTTGGPSKHGRLRTRRWTGCSGAWRPGRTTTRPLDRWSRFSASSIVPNGAMSWVASRRCLPIGPSAW